jgi:hypothetical protein
MNNKYISIKSILYDLSLTIDERYWNEIRMTEWLVRGFKQMHLAASLEPQVCQLTVLNHKTDLPGNFRYLTQVAEFIGGCDEDCFENQEMKWKPMRLTSNPYHNSICLDNSLTYCTDCNNEFSISPSLVLTTTLQAGQIMVAYLGYPTDDEGLILIPDDESVKEALIHYVLYRYWLSKYQMKEEGADQRVKFHLDMWSALSKKAHNVDLPDINQLENMMSNFNHLVPRTNKFAQLFLTLGNRENIQF